MRTIEQIKGNCRMEPGDRPDHEHWIWQGAYALSDNGKHRTPMVWAMDLAAGKMRTQSVPRALHQMRTGKPLPDGKTPRQMCTVPGCVHPDCWQVMSRRQYGAWQRETGFLATRHNYFESNRKTWDTRGRKVSHEAAQRIVSDPRVGREIAPEHGVTISTINRYKAGRLGARQRAGVFAGLLR